MRRESCRRMGIDRSYRLYVFDLDGTIADTHEDLSRAFAAAMEEAGYPAPSKAQSDGGYRWRRDEGAGTADRP